MIHTKCGDVEGLEMVLVPLVDPEGTTFSELSFYVFCSVYIKYSSGHGQFLCSDPKVFDQGVIHEIFSSTAVHQCALVGPFPFTCKSEVSGDSIDL